MLTRGEPRVDERVDISTSVVAGLKRVEQVGDDADGAEHSLDLVQVGPGRVEHGEYRQVVNPVTPGRRAGLRVSRQSDVRQRTEQPVPTFY